MRVPAQRSARSNTAAATTTGGKRSASSTSTSPSSAVTPGKKRKLQSDSSLGSKPSLKSASTSDASSVDQSSKRKQSLPNTRKLLHHPKKSEVANVPKTQKIDLSAKKVQLKKSNVVPLMGLKKIKIKEGKVPIKKVLTAGTTKCQKKLVKSAVKSSPSKKPLVSVNKKNLGVSSTSTSDSLPVTPTAEDEVSGSNYAKNQSETEDQHTSSQKKAQCRMQASSKINTKKIKSVKKPKNTSISVPVPLTRTKKLQQQQKLKPVKKINLKKLPVVKSVMVNKRVQQRSKTPILGGKKKIVTRRKQLTGECGSERAEDNTLGHQSQKGNVSSIRTQHEGQSNSVTDNLESNNQALSVVVQAVEKSVCKGNTKKAKDEESAIKKGDKKKILKKKPKIKDTGKVSKNETESDTGKVRVTENTRSGIATEPTKDKTEASVSPSTKESNNVNKGAANEKAKLSKLKQISKISDTSISKTKPIKKSAVLKPVKVISSKLKGNASPKMSSSLKDNKKPQQIKKKMSKVSVKKVVEKEESPDEFSIKIKEEESEKPLRNADSNDEDSSTSDEITLDVLLLRQQQMKKDNITTDDSATRKRTQSVSERSNCPSSPTLSEKQPAIQHNESEITLPLTSIKVEELSHAETSTLSPGTINTSDDEDLKSIKNRIKIKLEENTSSEAEEKRLSSSEKNSKKKSLGTKSKNDSENSAKSGGRAIKKEISKDDPDKPGKKKGGTDRKPTSMDREKQRTKKVIGLKKSGVKRGRSEGGKSGGSGSDSEQRARRMRLFGFWSGPKRHRVASLNALAKVHCLYENESRGAFLGLCSSSGGGSSSSSHRGSKPSPSANVSTEVTVTTTTRTLRSAPGLRGMGKHWDMHNASSTTSSSQSSDDNESNSDSPCPSPSTPPSYKQKRKQKISSTTSSVSCSIKKKTNQIKKNIKKVVRRRRNRCELMMDLKDMVVRKRMASLNASAILAASYSVEKRPAKTAKEDSSVTIDVESCSNDAHQVKKKKKKKKRIVTKKVVEVEDDSSTTSTDIEVEELGDGRGSSRSVIEVRTTPSGGPNSNKKVAVIVNQDTDVTITGVYVNSTTRSTHHEGFCSIAGMQYRISSTSHTQTEATAVATETVLHTTAPEHPAPQHPEPPLAPPMKSYTPLGALSNMQPPGTGVVGGPPPPPPPPPPHHHHHPHPHPHPPPCSVPPQQPPPPHRGGPVNTGGGPVHPPISPLGRRHGCTSAFSAPPPPPTATYGPPPQHPQPPPHHHPPHPPPQGQQDPAYIHGLCNLTRLTHEQCFPCPGISGYYQPAGPLISAHHHHHSSSSSSSSSITNTGKVPPAVLPTLEASPNLTPPPSATSHSGPGSVPPPTTTAVAPPTPQQLVSATSSGSGGGGARSGGDESSDNDVIITATSCSGGGEVAPPPPVPQPLPLQQHPHQTSYRYPQSYPPPPTPSTPQHIHHQSYTYNYPHTQYYPSPPSSASIQYSAVATNPPSLQQPHHYHSNQDLCYTGSANYPPPYFHKSYSTPPPSSYHRRYIPPPHPAQYYPSDLYSSPASNTSQQNSGQSQQSQQMVVTGSTTGSASSYQPPVAPPPPSLVGVSSNPPPPLVDTYPPPVSIVDPYPPPPGYYSGYSAGPGPAGCYSHSPPTRSLAFIDAAYQSCPCPMQSCPKNVHTGPLTGDGKGSHINAKQQTQQPPVQESGPSFHQRPLPPVALALPLEPPGALGPPSPARGSAGMPPPPSPATASARNPSHAQEEAAFQQRGWDLDSGNGEIKSKLQAKTMVKNKQEPSGQDYLGGTQFASSLDIAEDLQTKQDKEFSSDTITISSDEVLDKTDISRHRLLAISSVVTNTDVHVCRTKPKKISSPPLNNIPLLMCDLEFQKKRQNVSEPIVAKSDIVTVLEPKTVNNAVKTEVRNLEKEMFLENNKSQRLIQNGSKMLFRNGSSKKRKVQPLSNETKVETEVPKRRKLSTSNLITSRLSPPNQESEKTDGICEPEDQVKDVVCEAQVKCKNEQKAQPLSSNSCSLHNTKHTVRKRKLDDSKDLAENKEPVTSPLKKKGVAKALKVPMLQTKIYPSRLKQIEKASSKKVESMKRIDEVLDSVVANSRTVLEPIVTTKKNISSEVPSVNKKTGNKSVDHKKSETKVNGILSHHKKPSLRHQTVRQQQNHLNCLNGDASKIHIAQINAGRISVEGKKVHNRKKMNHTSISFKESVPGKKLRVYHMLRSHGLRDSLSDQSSSDDAESNAPKGKVPSFPTMQHTKPLTARRASTGSRKDQSKKPVSLVTRNDCVTIHHTHKKQINQQLQPQQQNGTQDLSLVLESRKTTPKRSLQLPKWSNGWKFEGVPFQSKVFLSSDDVLVTRKCYPRMCHEEGDVICPRDCILLKSGPRKTDLPFVAKVAALWENPDDGEMMVSLLWYYRPEHTDHGRRPEDMEDEIFASKHKDINSVACIEDKCYVLTFNEYCRYRKCVRRLEDGVKEPGLVVPQYGNYPRDNRQPPGCVASELVFFCRRVYDFRQRRILKNPG